LAEERLAVEVELSLGGTVADVFDIHGLKEAIGPLKAQCPLEYAAAEQADAADEAGASDGASQLIRSVRPTVVRNAGGAHG
jgi:hypothetical protein